MRSSDEVRQDFVGPTSRHIEVRHGDLDIYDVFRGEAGDRSRPDVINAEGRLIELITERRADGREGQSPPIVVVEDLQWPPPLLVHGAILGGRLASRQRGLVSAAD